MGDFWSILTKTWSFLKLPMNLYGFSVSYWDAVLWSAVIVLLVAFIAQVVLAASNTSVKGKKK